MKKILISLAFILATGTILAARDMQENVNRAIYDKVMASVSGNTDLGMGELVAKIAVSLYGTPYVASTLEGEKEELRIYLDKTDCILFVESCVCLALTAKGRRIVQGGTPLPAGPSYELYCDNVRNMRYRNGTVEGYASRLHYTSEWLFQASLNGILEEYTGKKGSEITQHFSFMTRHTALYPALAASPGEVARIREAEKMLEARAPYWSISQEQLRDSSVAAEIRKGDIVAFISTAEGLDISHVAIACPGEDGQMHFIHASSKAGKVIFEPETLADYARKGIRLARLNN